MINERHLPKTQIKPPRYARFVSKRNFEKYKIPLMLTVLHIPMGVLFYRVTPLAILHQLAVISLGLFWAFRKEVKLEKVAYVTAYIVGVEVLWRMAGAPILYEVGKYAVTAIMVTALVQRGKLKTPTLPLLYFVFLLPACFLTISIYGLFDSRKMLSGTMSGPLLLFVSCWFFSHLKISRQNLKKLLVTIAIPLISVGVATLFFTVTIKDIQFTTESNDLTSGGFGPNQVSAMLGLGAFVCLAGYLLFKNDFKNTLYLSILALFFTMQSVMTFSRGGMYNAIGGTLSILFFQMKNLGQGVKRFLLIAGLGSIFLLLIFPYLNNFTGGKLQERFESTNTTNRVDILETDFQMFMESPVFGVGTGVSKYYREKFLGTWASSHTEFTRVVSEHGLLGIFSLVMLGLTGLYNLRRQNTSMGKGLVAGAMIWGSLFMLNAGMRLAAPSFMWGLSFLTIVNFPMRRKPIFKRPPAMPRSNRRRKQLPPLPDPPENPGTD
ncbi:MAG: O-antigen ligase family protein [Pyrinomonadaceae bacterium]